MENPLKVNPWLSMWVRPRETIRQIVAANPRYRFILLCFVYGLPVTMKLAQAMLLGERAGVIPVLIVSIVLATFIGWVILSLTSLFVMWTGKIIKGKAGYLPLRAAVSWSNVPSLGNIIIWILMLIVLGTYSFQPHLIPAGAGYMIPFLQVSVVVQAILGIWSFVLFVCAIAEVQGFSAWMGLLNAVLAYILSSIAIFVIFWVIGTIVGSF